MINIKTVRVLHIVGNMNMGGQETFIMNVYRNIDRNKVQFDFVVHSNEEGYYDKEIERLGGKIYRICPIKKNPIKHMMDLYKIIKANKYEIIHRHTNSAVVILDLAVARFAKVKKRIVHSHSNNISKNRIIHKVLKYSINLFANNRMACSKEAGIWMYGNKDFTVIPNGIEVEKFLFNKNKRNHVRTVENAGNKKIIGHIGRFVPEKNHKFIVKLLEQIIETEKNIEIWFIGDGDLKEDIKNSIYELGLSKYARFLGIKENIDEYLDAMDIFIFPSIYEGLGIALIEAQLSGVDCIVSDNIQKEALITDNVTIKELDYKEWKDCILNKKISTERRIDINDERIKKYDILNIIRKLEDIYLGD